MKKAKRILINCDETIKSAIYKLEKTKERLLICVNKKNKFLGVINDGDIRRAIIKKAKISEKIKKYINSSATTVSDQVSESEAIKLINSDIMALPVIDSGFCSGLVWSFASNLLDSCLVFDCDLLGIRLVSV